MGREFTSEEVRKTKGKGKLCHTTCRKEKADILQRRCLPVRASEEDHHPHNLRR